MLPEAFGPANPLQTTLRPPLQPHIKGANESILGVIRIPHKASQRLIGVGVLLGDELPVYAHAS